MDHKGMDFPQYRKLSNEKAFYRIVDGRHFDELQRVGSKVKFYSFHAEQYPEILRINDMLELSSAYLLSSKSEFDLVHAQLTG